jgi:hypothetical protein
VKPDSRALKEANHEIFNFLARTSRSIRERIRSRARCLQVFNKDFKMPASFTMHQFAVRVGDYGGYIIAETDEPVDIHYFTSIFALFENEVEPVVDVVDVVAVELKAIEYRKKNAS